MSKKNTLIKKNKQSKEKIIESDNDTVSTSSSIERVVETHIKENTIKRGRKPKVITNPDVSIKLFEKPKKFDTDNVHKLNESIKPKKLNELSNLQSKTKLPKNKTICDGCNEPIKNTIYDNFSDKKYDIDCYEKQLESEMKKIQVSKICLMIQNYKK
jgi:hypothetical protein